MYVCKAFVDYLKHFFLTRMNKINPVFYSGMRRDMFKRLHQLDSESVRKANEGSPAEGPAPFEAFRYSKEVETAQKKIKWALLTTDVLDEETIVAASRNFLVLPQACVIMRTVIFILKQRRYPVHYLPKTMFKASLLLLVLRIVIKAAIQI